MKAERLIAIAAIAVVVTAILAGLLITGTPQHQRELRQDEQRTSDLARLARSLSRHYMEKGELPDSIDALVDGFMMTELPRDPLTNERYEYDITGQMTFRLCADFSHADDTPQDGEFFAHSAGRNCFDFDFSTLRLD